MSTTPPLPGIFHTLAPLLNHWGYLAVGGLVVLEDFGVPVPGETVLIAAAVYAGAGQLNVVAVAAIAFVAAIIGDNIGYGIGHFGGRQLVLRLGRYVFLTPARLSHAEAFMLHHGAKVVTVARFIEGLRQANGILAGISKMPWLSRFVPYNIAGAALWVGLWTAVGYTAGSHLTSLYHQIVHDELYVGIALIVLVIAYVAHRLLVRRRHGPGADGRDGDAGEPSAAASTSTESAN